MKRSKIQKRRGRKLRSETFHTTPRTEKQSERDRALRALCTMRRGVPLSRAARTNGVTPRTVKRYAGAALVQERPGGRIHARKTDPLLSYLAAVMRSSIVLRQTRHMMTGNTHPRVANEDVGNLIVPVPNPEVQEKIASEVARRRIEARRLRDEASKLWEGAKQQFERELLGSNNRDEERSNG